MADLIRANLFRLVHSRLFWLLVILSVVPGFWMLSRVLPVLQEGRMAIENNYLRTDMRVLLNAGPLILAYAASLLCASFDSAEYTNGTIHNKLARGCSRSAVFFSSLLVEFLALGVLLATYYAPFLPLGEAWNTGQVASMGWTLPELATTAILCAVCFTCLFHLVGSILGGRASLIAAPAILIALTGASVMLNVMLLQPQTYTVAVSHTADMGEDAVEDVSTEVVPNPNYVPEDVRPAYEFWQHAIPTGAAISGLMGQTDRAYWLYLGVDCVILVAAGATAFFRHNVN